MCGISGIINTNDRKVLKDEIETINNLIAHRGPDDEGYFYNENFAFGHRRLSILDLSSDGHQPMHYDSKYTITYNGEIYNYIEIRDELEQKGYIFNTGTDTEVILASYAEWGVKCVNKFNGMWAFCIFDKEKNNLFCSRDRFGVKPFYYTVYKNKFIFGSEIKQLLNFYDKRIVNKKILVDYLLHGQEEHTNQTFFENIFKLEQSHNLIYDLKEHTYSIERYYDINLDQDLNQLSEDDSVRLIENKLFDSIKLRLRSDVKVGTCLSGGLDSSSIAAIASELHRKNSNEKFVAIHSKSVEEKTDESYFANLVSEHCDLDMIQVEPKLDELMNYANEVIETQEEPFGGPSIFMQYFVMKSAKENGCTVMLDGQGGDESLFGYEGYFSFYFASLVKRLKFVKYLNEFIKLKPFNESKKRILKNSVLLIFRNQLSSFKRKFKKRKTYIKLDDTRASLDNLFSFKDFKNFQKRELMIRNLPHLLRYEDKNSMKHSIETRLPFVDYRFIEAAVSVNDEYKFKKGYLKYLLRKIVNNILPTEVVWRKNKFGFEAPEDMFIKKYRSTMEKEIYESKLLKHVGDISQKELNNQKIFWKLYNIAVWEKIYDVKFE